MRNTVTSSLVVPPMSDPRWVVFSLLATYTTLGILFLGFNRSPMQVILVIGMCCFLDMVLHKVINKKNLFPLSAAITGCSLSILVNYSHGLLLPLIPVFFAITSKYWFTAKQRHIFNPSLFGIICALLVGGGMITPAPAYQWGGSLAVALLIVTAAVFLFALRINRHYLIISFLIFYTLELALRAALLQHVIPPATIFMGAFTNPAFYLFTFFMITDPATSPNSRSGQIVMAFTIVLFDLILNTKQSYSTLFYAGFVYYSLRWIWLNIRHIKIIDLKKVLFRTSGIVISCLTIYFGYQSFLKPHLDLELNFGLEKLNPSEMGISTHPGDIFSQTDPKIAHVAKWLLSVGDAVAVADVNNNGLMDIFVTYPLKDKQDRAALYINKGNYQFERFEIPFLTERFSNPKENGLPSGALWFDFNNDGAKDLLVLVGYGKSILLKNRLMETGKLEFVLEKEFPYTISLTANVLDMNKNGWPDLIIANALSTTLNDYSPPRQLNIFGLPEPEYPGDRRMFNFMHRSWHNARNGGENLFYFNDNGNFGDNVAKALNLTETRWTLDIATGDFNKNGYTDLFLANDFGPDELLINIDGKTFKQVVGKFSNHIGRDTYKGMNASAADLTGNGHLDIYVSNVHHPLQAEGSQLWLNDGTLDQKGYLSFKDKAAAKNILNENRFGWGAAVGDINLNGKLDVVQANGMVDDTLDKLYDECPDFWYWNSKIAITSPDIHGYADSWADLRGRCIFPNERDRVYMNQGDKFVDVSKQLGIEEMGNSRGVALVDLNNDGHLDIIITDQFKELSVYRNTIKGKTWIGLNLQGNGKHCTRDALGTKVKLDDQFREVQASNGFSAQGDSRILFGLNDADKNTPVEIEIDWCGNQDVKTYKLLPNQYHKIAQS